MAKCHLKSIANPVVLREYTMTYVSLQAAMTLTEWSQRTIRRRIAEGALPFINRSAAGGGQNKTFIEFEALRAAVCIPLGDDDMALLEAADSGDAQAQNELAMLFLEHHKPKSAIFWLELAAKQNLADAMHHLGSCYLKGVGVAQDNHLAIIWIAKAAALGHPIACRQIDSIASTIRSSA
jgi:hypothetical protein